MTVRDKECISYSETNENVCGGETHARLHELHELATFKRPLKIQGPTKLQAYCVKNN